MALSIELKKITGSTGDREIFINGERYGRIWMIGHGCHGPSYEFDDAGGRRLPAIVNGKVSRHRNESVRNPRPSSYERAIEKKKAPPTEGVLIAKVKELFEAKRLQSPATIDAEMADVRRRMDEHNAESERERMNIRVTLIKLYHAPSMTPADRTGLALAFNEIFSTNIPAATDDNGENESRVFADALREYAMGLKSFLIDADEGDEVLGVKSDLATVETMIARLGPK